MHTLIDTSHYSGSVLPGFVIVPASHGQNADKLLVNGMDHVAFAMPKNSALPSIHWYEKVFGMKRFVVNQ